VRTYTVLVWFEIPAANKMCLKYYTINMFGVMHYVTCITRCSTL